MDCKIVSLVCGITIYVLVLVFIARRIRINKTIILNNQNNNRATVLSARLCLPKESLSSSKSRFVVVSMKSFFKIAEYSVQKTGGTFYKFGDGSITAIWGAFSTTGSVEHDALNAVRSALLLRVKLAKLNRKLSKSKNLKIACGINSGKVVPSADTSGNKYFLSDNLALKTREIAEKYGVDIVFTGKTFRIIEDYVIAESVSLAKLNGASSRIFALINLRVGKASVQPAPSNLKQLRDFLSEETAVYNRE